MVAIKRSNKTLKQKWAFERLYAHKGSLSGIIVRLRQIAEAKSTLPSEADTICNAISLLGLIDFSENKEQSLRIYTGRS